MVTALATVALLALAGAVSGAPPDAGTQKADSASYAMDWSVVDESGGGTTASASYVAEVTVGQSVVGSTTGGGRVADLGFWFGVDWVLFADGFESGDTTAWDSDLPKDAGSGQRQAPEEAPPEVAR